MSVQDQQCGEQLKVHGGCSEAYLKPSLTSKMKFFAKIVNRFQLGSENASGCLF